MVLGIGTVVRNSAEDEDDDELIVDGDDTQIYGTPQYTERDIRLISEEQESYLRDLVIVGSPVQTSSSNIHQSEQVDQNDNNPITREENNQNLANSISNNISTNKVDVELESKLVSAIDSPDSAQQVINSLKAKIREYENFIKNKQKCLICLDNYKIPLVSISCWHVYCENCWLYSLGARKLCPQCNMITSPTDLRRIYL